MNFTQADGAKLAGVSSQYVSNWERGVLQPSKKALVRLIAPLAIDVEVLTDLYVQKSRLKVLGDFRKAISKIAVRKKAPFSKPSDR